MATRQLAQYSYGKREGCLAIRKQIAVGESSTFLVQFKPVALPMRRGRHWPVRRR